MLCVCRDLLSSAESRAIDPPVPLFWLVFFFLAVDALCFPWLALLGLLAGLANKVAQRNEE